jgi:hypothetical protein
MEREIFRYLPKIDGEYGSVLCYDYDKPLGGS